MITKFNLFLEKYNVDVKSLYHILDFDRLKFIVTNDKMVGKHYSEVSFTKYKDMNGYLGAPPQSFYKLRFDQNLLAKDYKLEEFNYKSKNGEYFDEGEVRINRGITDPFKYITGIIVNYNMINSFYSKNKNDGFKLFSDNYEYNIKNQLKYIEYVTNSYNIPLLDNKTLEVAPSRFNDVLGYEFIDIKAKRVKLLYGILYDKKDGYKRKDFIIISDQVIFVPIGKLEITKENYEHPASPNYLSLLDDEPVRIQDKNVSVKYGYETDSYIFSSLNDILMVLYYLDGKYYIRH